MSNLPDNWDEIRAQVLERDEHQCVKKRPDCTTQLHVHHTHPKYFGGSHELANLVTLCSRCHAARHIELQVSLARRAVERTALAFKKIAAALGNGTRPVDYYPLLRLLTGSSKFRDGQKEAIEAVLAGDDVVVIRPTGSGKSLIFQLPALLHRKKSIVVSPLKALMHDQVQDLWQRGVPASFINSDLSRRERRERLHYFENGGFKLLYLAPERLDERRIRNTRELDRLRNTEIKYLIVDEAHSIEDWGWSFRPAYGLYGSYYVPHPRSSSRSQSATPSIGIRAFR